MTKPFSRRFGADPEISGKAAKQQMLYIFELVIGVVALIAAFAFADAAEGEWYNSSKKETYEILEYFCIFLGLLELGLSPIQLWLNSKLTNKLNNTFLVVEDNRVYGVHYTDSDVGARFEIPYSALTSATPLSDGASNKMNTLEIRSEGRTFKCFAIADRSIAAKLINDKCAEYNERSAANMFAPQTDSASAPVTQVTPAPDTKPQYASEGKKYCLYCATELPADAAFCFKCGKSQ